MKKLLAIHFWGPKNLPKMSKVTQGVAIFSLYAIDSKMY